MGCGPLISSVHLPARTRPLDTTEQSRLLLYDTSIFLLLGRSRHKKMFVVEGAVLAGFRVFDHGNLW